MEHYILLGILLFVLAHMLTALIVLLFVELPRWVLRPLWRRLNPFGVSANEQQRLAEIQAIGQQAREDMAQLSQEYLDIMFEATGGY